MVIHIVYHLNISFDVLPYMFSCAVAFLYLLEFIIVTNKLYNTVHTRRTLLKKTEALHIYTIITLVTSYFELLNFCLLVARISNFNVYKIRVSSQF